MILKNLFIRLINFLPRIFTFINLSTILIVFIVGFFTRFSINYFFNTNVFVDYLSSISIIYYSLFSCFIILTRDFFNYYSINIISNSVFIFFTHIFNIFKLTFSYINKFNFDYLKLSFLRLFFKDIFSICSKYKISVYTEESDVLYSDLSHLQKDIAKDTLIVNQDNIGELSSFKAKDKSKGKVKANFISESNYNNESNSSKGKVKASYTNYNGESSYNNNNNNNNNNNFESFKGKEKRSKEFESFLMNFINERPGFKQNVFSIDEDFSNYIKLKRYLY